MTLANADIRQQAERVLGLPAEERARFLLEAPKPMALVRALPDGEFYLTVREVGPQGALPLLALASAWRCSLPLVYFPGRITHGDTASNSTTWAEFEPSCYAESWPGRWRHVIRLAPA